MRTADGMSEAAADSQLMTYKMLGVDNKEVMAILWYLCLKRLHLQMVGRLWLGRMERLGWPISVHQVSKGQKWYSNIFCKLTQRRLCGGGARL